MEAWASQLEGSPCSPQLEEALLQQQRPSAAKKKKRVTESPFDLGLRMQDEEDSQTAGWQRDKEREHQVLPKRDRDAAPSYLPCDLAGFWFQTISLT